MIKKLKIEAITKNLNYDEAIALVNALMKFIQEEGYEFKDIIEFKYRKEKDND